MLRTGTVEGHEGTPITEVKEVPFMAIFSPIWELHSRSSLFLYAFFERMHLAPPEG